MLTARPQGDPAPGRSVLPASARAAVRETFEETGIVLDHPALQHVLSIHQRNSGTADTRIGFAFAASQWDGEPANAEPPGSGWRSCWRTPRAS
jgi:8-oxo-dGTP pyrophosphatase MutT (NUDIX family)